MNYQQLIQRTSDHCGIEFSILDEIITTLLTLAADQFQEMSHPTSRMTLEIREPDGSGNDFRFAQSNRS